MACASRSCRRWRSCKRQIWVYCLPEICDPLEGMPDAPAPVRAKIALTGLSEAQRRDGWRRRPSRPPPKKKKPVDEPLTARTPEATGDGETMIEWVISDL